MRQTAFCLCAAAAALLAGACRPAEGGPTNLTGLRTHPCLLFDQEGREKLRVRSADTTPNAFGFSTAGVWNTFRAKADEFLAAPPYHYGVQIPANGDQPTEWWEYTFSEKDPPPHPRTPWYPPWTAMFQERSDSISTRIKHLSFAYVITGDRRYAEKAKEMVLALCQWTQWTDPSYGGGRIRCCLDTGHATQNVALFYDWCYDTLSARERSLIRGALIEKGIQAILAGVDTYPADTNGFAVLTCGLGLAALAVRPDDPRGGEWLVETVNRVRRSLDQHGRDGGAFEGPMYGTYLLDSFAVLFDALESAKVQHDLFQHPFLSTMERYCIGLMAPDTRTVPCFGDGGPTAGYRETMAVLAARGSKEAAWYLKEIGALQPDTITSFIRFDAARFQPEQPRWNPSSVFVDIGHASLRDGFNAKAPYLCLKSGPPERRIGHNHYDHNAFVMSYMGQWLICDRGYHHFTHPPSRKFTLGTMGHNSLVIDRDEEYLKRTTVPDPGHDQVDLAGGRITAFFAGDGFDSVRGEAAEVYNSGQRKVLDRFTRDILYVKPHFFVVCDRIAAPAPHRYSLLLHADAAAEFRREKEAFLAGYGRAEVYIRSFADRPIQQTVARYPGAESYGPYLETQTDAAASANVVTFLYPRPSPVDRLIANPGFEGSFDGWTPRGGEDAPNHSVDREVKQSGESSGRIVKSGYFYSSRFALPQGTRVRARFFVRTQGGTGGAVATFYFWRAGKAFANVSSKPIVSDNWAPFELEAVVPPNCDDICLALTYSGGGTAWFDTVTLSTNLKVDPALTPQIAPLGNGTQGLDVRLGKERFILIIGAAGRETAVQV
ncbi:MAG: heparinase II/III family protein, partial [Armatimonadota bacterium]|nr:heparinase II/III family protein [Armatimonadota bacterium]